MVVPLPLLALDSRLSIETRAQRAIFCLLGQVFLKFWIGNILEVKLAEWFLFDQDSDQGEVHPVFVLLSVVICGEIWGPAGMLISVPLLALGQLFVARKLQE